ncbi:acinetobactin biosynthesis protein [Acinetobacter haemolyticus]|nr:acinetobactin biosynthesis protein [Acinetobacter haemolyticus]
MLELFDGQQYDIETQTLEHEIVHNSSKQQSDLRYWEEKFSRLTDIPQLPWTTPLQQLMTSRYQRKKLIIAKDQFKKLSKIGAKHSLFKNSVIMSVILQVLSHWSTNRALCVAIPTLPLYTGPFVNSSTFIAVEWKYTAQFVQQANQLQTEILAGLQHLSFSGVDLARLLFEKTGKVPVLPIVITNGLSWSVLPESHAIQLQDGLTQTPQVAIDIRFSTGNDEALVFDIDYAEDALSAEMIDDFLHMLQSAIYQIIDSNIFTFDLTELVTALQSNRQYFKNNVAQYQYRSLQNSTVKTTKQRHQLLQIYLEALGQSNNDITDDSINFTHLGLRPQHLKIISKRIRETYAIQLSPAQLIHCRKISDVEKLLVSHSPVF